MRIAKMIKTTDIDGTHRYTNDVGQLHREEGPAVVDKRLGYKEWYQHGNLYRANGPVIVYDD